MLPPFPLKEKVMNNELFTLKPSLKQYYGVTVTKEKEFDEYTDNKEIHQTLKDFVLTTEINKEWEHGGIKSKMNSVITEELPEGTVLIWSEAEGFVVPNVSMCKLKDVEADIQAVKEVYKDNTDINPIGQ